LRFVDLDNNEYFTLRAWDASHNPILTPWIDDAVSIAGDSPTEFVAANMPTYNISGGVYTFRGAAARTPEPGMWGLVALAFGIGARRLGRL
jgi:hypothetical protein